MKLTQDPYWKVRERAGRDGNGNFVGISCDEESPVAPVEKAADNEEDAASVRTQEEELAKREEEEDMNWCLNMS